MESTQPGPELTSQKKQGRPRRRSNEEWNLVGIVARLEVERGIGFILAPTFHRSERSRETECFFRTQNVRGQPVVVGDKVTAVAVPATGGRSPWRAISVEKKSDDGPRWRCLDNYEVEIEGNTAHLVRHPSTPSTHGETGERTRTEKVTPFSDAERHRIHQVLAKAPRGLTMAAFLARYKAQHGHALLFKDRPCRAHLDLLTAAADTVQTDPPASTVTPSSTSGMMITLVNPPSDGAGADDENTVEAVWRKVVDALTRHYAAPGAPPVTTQDFPALFEAVHGVKLDAQSHGYFTAAGLLRALGPPVVVSQGRVMLSGVGDGVVGDGGVGDYGDSAGDEETFGDSAASITPRTPPAVAKRAPEGAGRGAGPVDTGGRGAGQLAFPGRGIGRASTSSPASPRDTHAPFELRRRASASALRENSGAAAHDKSATYDNMSATYDNMSATYDAPSGPVLSWLPQDAYPEPRGATSYAFTPVSTLPPRGSAQVPHGAVGDPSPQRRHHYRTPSGGNDFTNDGARPPLGLNALGGFDMLPDGSPDDARAHLRATTGSELFFSNAPPAPPQPHRRTLSGAASGDFVRPGYAQNASDQGLRYPLDLPGRAPTTAQFTPTSDHPNGGVLTRPPVYHHSPQYASAPAPAAPAGAPGVPSAPAAVASAVPAAGAAGAAAPGARPGGAAQARSRVESVHTLRISRDGGLEISPLVSSRAPGGRPGMPTPASHPRTPPGFAAAAAASEGFLSCGGDGLSPSSSLASLHGDDEQPSIAAMNGVLRRQSPSPQPAVVSAPPPSVEALFAPLLALLPSAWRTTLLARSDLPKLERIKIDVGRPVTLRLAPRTTVPLAFIPSRADVDALVSSLPALACADVAHVPGTLHAVAALRNAARSVVGLSIRIGLRVDGAADLIRDIILRKAVSTAANAVGGVAALANGRSNHGTDSILIVGPSGVGKTNLLRDALRILCDAAAGDVVVVDAEGMLGGAATDSWPSIRFLASPSICAGVDQALRHHDPTTLIIDDISSAEDAAALTRAARHGVRIVGAVCAASLQSLVHDAILSDVLLGGGTRREPLFATCVEMRERHQWDVHIDLAASIASILRNESPLVHRRSVWPSGGPAPALMTAVLTTRAFGE